MEETASEFVERLVQEVKNQAQDLIAFRETKKKITSRPLCPYTEEELDGILTVLVEKEFKDMKKKEEAAKKE